MNGFEHYSTLQVGKYNDKVKNNIFFKHVSSKYQSNAT